ncbi:MAG: hypothetical protein C4524_00665 [Candidatus Zixiibacteriota bacterium]|nr:MAG: hypothetical protein C4524_00665 [candidate division Zixibacteria bacterium]
MMKHSAFTLLLAAALILAGCSIKEPGSPSWQVEVTVPVANRAYSLMEIVSDSAEVDSLGNWISLDGETLIFNVADSLARSTVGDRLEYDAFDDVLDSRLGVREIQDPGSSDVSFPVAYLAPWLPLNQTAPVPPFSFSVSPMTLEDYDAYDWINLAWGQATVRVTNHLPTPLTDLVLQVEGISPSLQIINLPVPGTLAPGQTYEEVCELPHGQVIDNAMAIILTGSSPGSASPVFLGAAASVDVEVELSDLGVIAGRAHLVSQSFEDDSTYCLSDDDVIILSDIKEGDLSYTIENRSNLINTVTFLLPDFLKDGQPYTEQVTLEPNQTHTVSLADLAGYQFSRPQGDNLFDARIVSDLLDSADPLYGGADPLVEFSQANAVYTHYDVSTLYFSHFEGELDTVEINMEQEPEVLENIPEGLESLAVESAVADLHLFNTMGLPVTFDMAFEAYKDGLVAATFDVPPLTIPAGGPGGPGVLVTDVPGLETLVNVLPDSIRTTGQGTVLGAGVINDDQYLEGYYHIYSPFYFSLDETTLEPEVSVLDDGLNDELAQVDLSLNLENHLPLMGEAMILASFDSAQFRMANSPAVDTLMRVPLPAPQLDAQGYVAAPGVATAVEVLTDAELELFRQTGPDQPLYVQTFIQIQSTGGETVRCQATDYVSVGAAARLILNVNADGNN